MTRSRSRLTRRLEKESKRTLFLTSIGIIGIIILIAVYGVPLLVDLSVFIDNFRGNKEIAITNGSPSFVEAPILDTEYSATFSAQITVKGTSLPKHSIKLFVNNKLTDIIETKDDGVFSFDGVSLSEGKNAITAKAVNENDKESNFSQEITATHRAKPPSLEAYAPKGGESYHGGEKNLKVTGKTDVYAKITVNEFWAIVDAGGNFSYTLPLQNGENTIKVVATDEAGNKTEYEVKVTYSE